MKTLSLFEMVDALRRRALASDPDLASAPVPIREARLLGNVLLGLPIGLEPDETLAGDIDEKYLPAGKREEILADLDKAHSRHHKAKVKNNNELMWDGFHCGGSYSLAHTCADYRRIIERGLVNVLDEIEARRRQALPVEIPMLDAMRLSVEAVGHFAERLSADAASMAEREKDPASKSALRLIADSCAVVPMRPARSFHEAVQSVWLIHVCVGVSERCAASLSLGRLDQYLLPFFRRDLASGVKRDSMKRALRNLWLKLNRFGDAACAVNLGGLDVNGLDLFNELSELILEVETELLPPSPIITARIHDKLPKAVFDSLLDKRLFKIGQPTFYGEESCREAMIRRGVPAAEAHGFSLNSCMGLVMPGEEISDMWGAIVNMPVALELALNKGEPFTKQLPVRLKLRAVQEPTSFEQLFNSFQELLSKLVDYCVELNASSAKRTALESPNPFLSSITRGCIRRAADRAWGGADYHCVIVEGFGWVNVSDALVVINRLVFKDHKFALTELVDAAKNNFKDRHDIMAAILSCPAYGNADVEADAIAARVSAMFASTVSRLSHDNFHYLPSYHTLNTHVGAGAKTSATLDGRRSGEPLGKQLGPTPGRVTKGMTGVMLSAAAINQRDMSGGQALDLSIDLKELDSPKWRDGFKALLLGYFKLGGMQVQVNGVSGARLREAIKTPERHGDVIVRIAGYSAKFTNLGKDVQEEMASRVERGL